MPTVEKTFYQAWVEKCIKLLFGLGKKKDTNRHLAIILIFFMGKIWVLYLAVEIKTLDFIFQNFLL
jgi:hypothetical protein